MSRRKIRRPEPRTDEALRNFEGGFNCSQSVLAAFSRELGLPPGTGHRLSQAFGGGLARTGRVCGAVTGALMVLGLEHGKRTAGDDAARDKTYALAREFMRRFKEKHASLDCRSLLGHDIGTPRGAAAIKRQSLHKTVCVKVVRDAVRILEKLPRK
jgi:C_GCAxxG_C_C family probable redox protein